MPDSPSRRVCSSSIEPREEPVPGEITMSNRRSSLALGSCVRLSANQLLPILARKSHASSIHPAPNSLITRRTSPLRPDVAPATTSLPRESGFRIASTRTPAMPGSRSLGSLDGTNSSMLYCPLTTCPCKVYAPQPPRTKEVAAMERSTTEEMSRRMCKG